MNGSVMNESVTAARGAIAFFVQRAQNNLRKKQENVRGNTHSFVKRVYGLPIGSVPYRPEWGRSGWMRRLLKNRPERGLLRVTV
jgi:hypothetical protein